MPPHFNTIFGSKFPHAVAGCLVLSRLLARVAFGGLANRYMFGKHPHPLPIAGGKNVAQLPIFGTPNHTSK